MAIKMTDEERVELYRIVHSIVASERLKVVERSINGYIRPLLDELLAEAHRDFSIEDPMSWEKLAEFTGLPEGADIPAHHE